MTTRLEDFGLMELDGAGRLLFAVSETGWPDEFELDEVQLDFDSSSGEVFLTNSLGQVLVLEDGIGFKLRIKDEREVLE